jgi:hypothetical protein
MRHLLEGLLVALCLILAAGSCSPVTYLDFDTSVAPNDGAALTQLLVGTGTNYIYLQPGTYTLQNPVTINRSGVLYLHGIDRLETTLVAANPSQPLFIVTAAPLISIAGVSLFPTEAAQGTTLSRAIKFQNAQSVTLEMFESVVDDSTIEIDGPGSYRLQAVSFYPNRMTDAGVLVNHAGADVLIWGGDASGFGPSGTQYPDAAVAWQKLGRLRVYATSTESTTGNAAFRIESASPAALGPFHVIANSRSEETQEILYVPTTTSAVNVALKADNVASSTGLNCNLATYNGAGVLWMVQNVLGSCGQTLVNGTASGAARVVSVGNVISGPTPFMITGAQVITAEDEYDTNVYNGGSTPPVTRWTGGTSPTPLSSYAAVPALPGDVIPPPLSRPQMPGTMPGLTSVKSAPYNAAGDGTTDDTAAIQALYDSTCTTNQPPHFYFPAGTYRTTNTGFLNSHLNPKTACNGANIFGAGGAIFGAGSAVTSIVVDAGQKKGTFQTDGLSDAVIQGITFKTWSYQSGDPENPNVDLESRLACVGGTFNGWDCATNGDSDCQPGGFCINWSASQQDYLYDTVIDGGYAGFANGILFPSGGQCSNQVMFGGAVKDTHIGFAAGNFNAISDGPYGTAFSNNDIAIGSLTQDYVSKGTITTADATHLTDSSQNWPVGRLSVNGQGVVRILDGRDGGNVVSITANTATQLTVSSWSTPPQSGDHYVINLLPAGGEFFAYDSSSTGTRVQDTLDPAGVPQYWNGWTTDAPFFFSVGASWNSFPLMYENSTLTPTGSMPYLFDYASGAGPVFLHSTLTRSGIRVGQGGGAESYAIKLASAAPDWSSAVSNPPNGVVDAISAKTIGIDAQRSTDGSGTLNSGAFSTTTPSDLLIAFVTYDGPNSPAQTATVSGAGLAWQLVQRSNAKPGTAEIWVAQATSVLTSVTVSSQQGTGGSYHGSLTVIAFTNASGTGNVGQASFPSGAPDVSLPGVTAGNWVFAVGSDGNNAIGRAPLSGQVLVHQDLDTQASRTYWVQSTAAPSTADGPVDISDSAPTTDQWNYAAAEIVAIW